VPRSSVAEESQRPLTDKNIFIGIPPFIRRCPRGIEQPMWRRCSRSGSRCAHSFDEQSKLTCMSNSFEESSAPDPVEQMFWEEVSQLLLGQVKQTTRAIELCLQGDLWEPALVLMLSFIDACAWLARALDHADVKSEDFITWVEKYLLPDSKLECTAEELYGARCGMLHSLTGESRLHRQEKVRKIYWSRSQDDNVYTLLQLRMNEKFLPVGVGIDHLFWALGKALDRFGEDLDSNAELGRLVGDRIHQSYFTKVRRLT